MRESLTIFACFLIAVLTAALIGPCLVDWTAQRAFVEAQLTRTLGARVTTHGPIGLVLLPTPRLDLGGLDIVPALGGSLHSGAVRLELAVMPLLRGEFRFMEASIDQPEVRLSLSADGSLPGHAPNDSQQDVRFERIELHGGRFTLDDPASGRSLTLAGLDLRAEASALTGPFRGEGAFALGDSRVGFHFSTGARDGERMRLKWVSDEAGDLPKVDLDGMLVLDGPLGFEGNSVISGQSPLPWRAAGPLRLDAAGLALDPGEVRIGGDDLPVTLTGHGKYAFAAGLGGEIALSARQVDADRLVVRKDGGPGIGETLRRWFADPNIGARLPGAVRITLATPTLTLGQETLTDSALDLGLRPGQPVALRVSAAGPGRSRLALDGQLETGAAARFSGHLEGAAGDPDRLAAWLAPALPEAAATLRALPVRNFEFAGDMDVSAAGFAARKLRLRADRSTFTGAAAFTRALAGERARLYADLASDALDIDAIPDLAGMSGAWVGADLSLALEAHAVRVTRFGDGMIDAGNIRLKLVQDAGGLRLEQLSIADLGGASLTASGAAEASKGALDVRVDAERLVDLATFVRRMAPGPLADAFARRAVALSPAHLDLKLQATRVNPSSPFALTGLALEASARGTRMQAQLSSAGPISGAAGALTIESADATMLLRQFGLDAVPMPGAGAGRLEAKVQSRADGGLDLDLTGKAAGVTVAGQGSASGSWQAPLVEGTLSIDAPDAAPLLRLTGYGLPDLTQALPVRGSGRLRLSGGRLALSSFIGSIAGSVVGGDVEAALGGDRLRLKGALDLDHASLPSLASLLLGVPVQPRAGAIWSSSGFAPGMVELPDAEIALRVGSLELMRDVVLEQAGLRLVSGPGVLNISELVGTPVSAAGTQGRLGGRLAFRRDGATVFLTGAASVSGVGVPGGWAGGTLSGNVDFSSSGSSPAALVGALAGSGGMQWRDLSLARADPAAPQRVVVEADAGNIYLSENDFLGALRRELEKGSLTAAARDFDLQLANGTARLAASDLAATLDLRSLSFEARANLEAQALPRDWTGAPPRLALIWRGPLIGAPRDGSGVLRDLDAGNFINLVAARAIAREVARIDALDADLRERAFFARRLRGLEFLHKRQSEVDAYVAERARLADEERLKAQAQRLERAKRQPIDFQAPAADADPSQAGRY